MNNGMPAYYMLCQKDQDNFYSVDAQRYLMTFKANIPN
jgi:hypothetical protein